MHGIDISATPHKLVDYVDGAIKRSTVKNRISILRKRKKDGDSPYQISMSGWMGDGRRGHEPDSAESQTSRTHFVPCIKVGAMLTKSLRRSDSSVHRREMQRGATLRTAAQRHKVKARSLMLY